MEDFGINLVLAETVASSADDLGLLQILGMLLGILGLVFFLGSAVGMVRFPDFYTRMHAVGKGDTLSTMLMLIGFGLLTMEDYSIVSGLVFVESAFGISDGDYLFDGGGSAHDPNTIILNGGTASGF